MDYDPYAVDLDNLLAKYLVHSFIYYKLGTSKISDECYDQTARRLYDNWEDVKHQHKMLVDKDGLLSGGHYIKFPPMVEFAAYGLFKEKPKQQDMKFNVLALRKAIDEWSLNMGEENIHVKIPDNKKKKREHLGLSEICEPCFRASYLKFRKVKPDDTPARIMRLFQRGHREEFFFAHMLSQVGLKLWHVDPKTKKQFKVSDFEGHLQGSFDTIAKDVGKLFIKVLKPFLVEYKTSNTSRFKALTKDGLKKSNPKYYGQIQGYMGYEKRLIGCLFCSVCKDTDELYFEWIEPDDLALDMIRERAEILLNTNTPPARIAKYKADWRCKMCDLRNHCWDSKVKSQKSCRSCRNGMPAEAGRWECTVGNEFGEVCDSWEDCNVK